MSWLIVHWSGSEIFAMLLLIAGGLFFGGAWLLDVIAKWKRRRK